MKENSVAKSEEFSTPGSKVFPRSIKGELIKKMRVQGSSIREGYSERELSIEGSKSGTIVFIKTLKVYFLEKYRGEIVRREKRLGFQLKTLERISVPRIQGGAISHVTVEAGSIFDVTSEEAGALASRLEYGGVFNGEGGKEVSIKVVPIRETEEYTSSLRCRTSPIDEFSDNVTMTGKDGKLYVKPEYLERWGYLIKREIGKESVSNIVGEAKTEALDLSAALRSYNQRRGIGLRDL